MLFSGVEEDQNFDDLDQMEPDSYHKFLALMIEMAENDDGQLDSPAFMERIMSLCAQKQRHITKMNAQSHQQSFDCHLEVPTLDVPGRQHSVESTCSSKYSRSTRSRDEQLDPKTRFRRTKLSRQKTVDYSDDGDFAGGLSGASSFERDDYNDPVNDREPVLINELAETSFIRDTHRPPLWKNNSCTTYSNVSPSFSDLLNVQNRRKSKSLMTMRKTLSECRPDEPLVLKLDDNLLESNMADILYSVEALWPKIPKSS